MKSLIVPGMLLTFLSIAAAQQSLQPTLSLNQHRNMSAQGSGIGPASTLPSLCKPCIFYGGDNNQNDPNTEGFPDGNTLSMPDTTTYAAVDVPATAKGVITGILFMIYADQTEFNPQTATYDIRVGLSDGNSGTSVASGSGPAYITLGQDGPLIAIWQVAVNLAPPLTVKRGIRYWFNLSPQCTDGSDQGCHEQFFEMNTTQETNGLNANAQPANQMFFNSALYGYSWVNWCDPALGLNAQQCARASFGLMGHR
jgi:hypothetical protein